MLTFYELIRWVAKGGVWEAISGIEEKGMQSRNSSSSIIMKISPFKLGDLWASNEILLRKEHGADVCCLRGGNQLRYRTV